MKKKILITGSSGMLGTDLVNVFSADNNYKVFALSRHSFKSNEKINFIDFDLNKSKKIGDLLKKTNPDIIIHSAALVNVDACENDHLSANKLHIEATSKLASFKSDQTRFIYISTDSVFDGKIGNYLETSKTHPLNYYAKSKLLGEQEALTLNNNSLVVRTNIYGFHKPAGNSLFEKVITTLNNGEIINGFKDVIFNPVYTRHLAIILKKIIEKKVLIKGILNIGVDEAISKYDFSLRLARSFKKDINLIKPGLLKDAKLKAPRPRNTTLNNSKLKNIIHRVPSLQQGLRALKIDYKKSL